MAKKTEAVAPDPIEQTALAPANDNGDALALDDLHDGLSEVDRSDFKIRTYTLNINRVGPDGRKYPQDEYYDTIAETTKRTVDAVFLDLHKSRNYSYFVKGEGTKRVCSSFDSVTGRMEDGTERPCKGCPDWEWTRKDGKPHRNCGPVYNMFAVDRETSQPFVYRAKKTALPVLQTYLQQHHINQRVQQGRRSNIPLVAYQVTLGAEMDKKTGNYALPTFTRGPMLTSAEAHMHSANAKVLREAMLPVLEQAESAERDERGESGDTSFDVASFQNGPSSQRGFIE